MFRCPIDGTSSAAVAVRLEVRQLVGAVAAGVVLVIGKIPIVLHPPQAVLLVPAEMPFVVTARQLRGVRNHVPIGIPAKVLLRGTADVGRHVGRFCRVVMVIHLLMFFLIIAIMFEIFIHEQVVRFVYEQFISRIVIN